MNKILCEYLNKFLRENNISQKYIYSKAGISKSYMSQIVSGKKYPCIDTWNNICNALDVSLYEFIRKANLMVYQWETMNFNEKIKSMCCELGNYPHLMWMSDMEIIRKMYEKYSKNSY